MGISYEFDILNSGNTPAAINRIAITVSTVFKTGRPKAELSGYPAITEIQGKASRHFGGGATFRISPEERELFRNNQLFDKSAQYAVSLKGTIIYRDIFNERQKTRWCWTDIPHLEYPEECSEIQAPAQ